MFNNAGKKLRSVATIAFSIFAILCAILIVFSFATQKFPMPNVIIALAVLLAAYLGCLALSAFGEIAENVNRIADQIENKSK